MTAPRLVRMKTGGSARGVGPQDDRSGAAPPRARRAPTAASGAPPASSEEAIRVRAYFLSLERQRDGSDAVQNWLDAEREVTREATAPSLRRASARRRDA